MMLFPLIRGGFHSTQHPNETHVRTMPPYGVRIFEKLVMKPDEGEIREFAQRFAWRGKPDDPLWLPRLPKGALERIATETTEGNKTTITLDCYAFMEMIADVRFEKAPASDHARALALDTLHPLVDFGRGELVFLRRDLPFVLAVPFIGVERVLTDAPIFRGITGPLLRAFEIAERAGLVNPIPSPPDLDAAYAPLIARFEATPAALGEEIEAARAAQQDDARQHSE